MLRLRNKYFWLILLGLVLFFYAGGDRAWAAPPVGPVGYVRAGQLNVRSGPGLNYNVISMVYGNDTLSLTGRTADNGWLQVRLPPIGQEGWVMARYVEIGSGSINDLPIINGGTPPSPLPVSPTATVAVNQLNVRGGPGLGYNVIATLGWGDHAPLLGRSSDGKWLQIQVSSPYPTFAIPTGWVLARYVWSSVPIFQLPVTDGGAPPPPNNLTGLVAVPRLNVRSGPGFGFNIAGQLSGGQSVKLLGRTSAGDWLKVEWGGYPGQGMPTYTGWVLARYLNTSVPINNLPIISDQPTARRIQFEPGSSSATLWDSLPPNGIGSYILTAQAGQTMTVEVIPAWGQTLFSISGANGEVLKSAGAGSTRWSGVLPLTQDYFIAVSTPDGSAINYTLQVSIPPR